MNSGTNKLMLAREKPLLVVVLLVTVFLTLAACAGTNNSYSSSRQAGVVDTGRAVKTPVVSQPACPVVAPVACKQPEPDLATEAAVRKLVLGNDWHREGRYSAALEAYESVLVEQASLLADAYALWGIIALRLDRENPDYDRENAKTVSYVLDQRIRNAKVDEARAEARLLWFSVQTMLVADVSKDNVVTENLRLRKELAQREEAIQRLRELTVGR